MIFRSGSSEQRTDDGPAWMRVMTSSTTGRSDSQSGSEPLDDEVRQDDPRHVGMLGLRPPHHLGRRPPELLERALDLAEIDGDSLTLQECVGVADSFVMACHPTWNANRRIVPCHCGRGRATMQGEGEPPR